MVPTSCFLRVYCFFFAGYFHDCCQILADVAALKATLASTEKKKAELEGQARQTTDQLK